MSNDLELLRKSKRKSPKKMARPVEPPTAFYLKPRSYDDLRKLVEWVDTTPDEIELTEGIWDYIQWRFEKALHKQMPKGWGVVSMQIETAKTQTDKPNTTLIGDLVALVEEIKTDSTATSEIHVSVYRLEE